MSNELISICVPLYNHQDYIIDALNSIKEQSYPRKELVIIDDGSKDDSYEIACDIAASQSFKAAFEHIKVRKNSRNRGAPYTLNNAIGSSNGAYISLINSDDLYHEKRLETLVSAEPTAEYFAFSKVTPMSAKVGDDQQLINFITDATELILRNSYHVSWAFLNSQVAISTGNFFFSRKLFDTLGGFRNLPYCHDWDFALRALQVVEPVYFKEALYSYRLHESNAFRALSHVAEKESIQIMRDYQLTTKFQRPQNKLCLCTRNFPTIFNKVKKLYVRTMTISDGALSYPTHFRTIDHPLYEANSREYMAT